MTRKRRGGGDSCGKVQVDGGRAEPYTACRTISSEIAGSFFCVSSVLSSAAPLSNTQLRLLACCFFDMAYTLTRVYTYIPTAIGLQIHTKVFKVRVT